MMIRIVKMTFRPGALGDFRALFETVRPQIEQFEGCHKVELLEDISDPCTLMTYSLWQSPQALENYRNSGLFRETWAKTKVLFAGKPKAWSFRKLT